ncbi:hypothetical protein P0W64_16340 [Tsukamurella sp. 8F]|uniref:hypothetical protein n=1 Tax=unclassified Tsukamurella TaxID=2633480 RepID=UPI0023B9BADB|nr:MULTISPECIES: hypothetical protein [unclassified Tsukamurella]MDF0531105.1 hypothetical protein [Tsukamurella sp. 8J]MDF0588351.1 hypothetical protein [Tsukamurella sp. 8F]
MLTTSQGVVIPTEVAVPVLTAIGVVPLAIGGIVYLARRTSSGRADAARWGAAACAVWIAWLVAVVALARAGILFGADAGRWVPLWVLITWAIPIVVVPALARRSGDLLRGLGARVPLTLLTLFETGRVVGSVFIELHHRGTLPALFAYPAGWGDVAIGVTAPGAAAIVYLRHAQVHTPGTRWRRLFLAWGVAGFAEMLMAVTLGLGNYPGVLRIFHGSADTAMFAEPPMLLFPTFLVTTATTLHVLMIQALRRTHLPTTTPPVRDTATL